MAGNITANNSFRLMDLPAEIRQRIFSLAVTTSESITPIHFKDRSNRFFWSKSQPEARDAKKYYRRRRQGYVYGSPTLTAVQLSTVSKQVYTEVVRTHLFYQVNQFEFLKISDMVSYLVAITLDRLSAIRSIKTSLPLYPCQKATPDHIYTLLTACKGLQKLEFIVTESRDLVYIRTLKPSTPNFSKLLMAVQGLKDVSVNFVTDIRERIFFHHYYPLGQYATPEEAESAGEEWCKELENTIRGESVHERSFDYSIKEFEEAQNSANLDLIGSRRINYDPKEGAVANRTRHQRKNLENIDSDGTIIQRDLSKYDHNGRLNWRVIKVLGSRKAGEGIYGLEFRVHSLTWAEGWSAYETTSWENVSALTSISNRIHICNYYEKHPKAHGKKLVLDTWKLEDSAPDEDDKDDGSYGRKITSPWFRDEINWDYYDYMAHRNPNFKRPSAALYVARLNEMIMEDTRRDQQRTEAKAKASNA